MTGASWAVAIVEDAPVGKGFRCRIAGGEQQPPDSRSASGIHKSLCRLSRHGRDFVPEPVVRQLYKVGTLAPPIAYGFLAHRHREAKQEPANPEADGSAPARTLSAMPRRHLASER